MSTGWQPPARTAQKSTLRQILGAILVAAVVIIVLIWTIFPLYWAAISSVKSSGDNYGNLWLPWVDFQPTLKPWRDMFALPEVRASTIISTQLAIGAATLSLGVTTDLDNVVGIILATGIIAVLFVVWVWR